MTDYETLKADFDETLTDAFDENVPDARAALGRMYRALLARAEAAEAAREETADRLVFEMEQRETLAARVAELEATLISNSELDNGPWHVLSETVAERNRLADRVAELEAQLVAQSAQGWRDFTERPPIGEQIQIATVIDAVREEPDGLYRIGNTSEWQAWRPAPQEPTP